MTEQEIKLKRAKQLADALQEFQPREPIQDWEKDVILEGIAKYLREHYDENNR